MDEETVDDVRDNVDAVLIKEFVEKTLTVERERKVIIARFWEGKTLKETGKELGITYEPTRIAESRGIRRFRSNKMMAELVKVCPDRAEPAIKRRRIEEKEDAEEDKKIWEDWKRKQKESEARQKQLYIFRTREIHFPKEKPFDKSIPCLKDLPKPVPSTMCPSIVMLKFRNDGSPYLFANNPSGYIASIERHRDPETYDRWLAQRMNEYDKER